MSRALPMCCPKTAVRGTKHSSPCADSSIPASCTCHTGAGGGPCSGHSRPGRRASPGGAVDKNNSQSEMPSQKQPISKVPGQKGPILERPIPERPTL